VGGLCQVIGRGWRRIRGVGIAGWVLNVGLRQNGLDPGVLLVEDPCGASFRVIRVSSRDLAGINYCRWQRREDERSLEGSLGFLFFLNV